MNKMQRFALLIGFGLSMALTLSCDDDGSITDKRDNKKYKSVKIGEQVWMAENLNFEIEGSQCYENDPANCAKYGRLYDWNAAMKACPKGWHLPNQKEWWKLVGFAGDFETVGKKLKAKNGWNNDDNGTDDYGFAALPGGDKSTSPSLFDVTPAVASFRSVGNGSFWWTADSIEYVAIFNPFINGSAAVLMNNPGSKTDLRSVRCVKD